AIGALFAQPGERFSLPQIPEAPDTTRVIAMDYLLFRRLRAAEQGGRIRRPDRPFRTAFDMQYQDKRIPLELGPISR
ncbi:hypothetical protein AB0V78_33020, partial [Mesorhizobium ciceri]